MPVRTVQLNHPGPEKDFDFPGYRLPNNPHLLREWNDDDDHYRKFIKNEGYFLKSLQDHPKPGLLQFWGEWEGNSFLDVIGNGRTTPHGIHRPLHSTFIRGKQNTDPFIYGDFFKYAICIQNGIMRDLDPGSLILFGSTTKLGFALDTVFVVRTHEDASKIRKTKAAGYTQVYKEATLKQLKEYLKRPFNNNQGIRLYQGQTFRNCKKYFSFVPCRDADTEPFEKLVLDFKSFPWLTRCRQGHPYKHLENRKPIDVWNAIVDFVITKDFWLGIKFTEPPLFNLHQLI
jgi:hypothetical protein